MFNFLAEMNRYKVLTHVALVFTMLFTYTTSSWYMTLSDPNNSQGAYASTVVLAALGVIKFWIDSKLNMPEHRKTSAEEE